MLRRRKSPSLPAVLFTGLSLLALSCSRKEEPFYRSSELGIDIEDFDWVKAAHTTGADGHDVYDEPARVIIEGKEHSYVLDYEIQKS